MDISSFNTIIASGGYGAIYISDKYNKYVYKKMYKHVTRKCAKYEYELHQKIYDSYLLYKSDIKLNYNEKDNIYIPKPIEYIDLEDEYGYIMEKINYIDSHFIHICLNSEIKYINKVVGKDRNKVVDDKNPPRGLYANHDMIMDKISNYISINNEIGNAENIFNIDYIIKQIGILYGILLYGAGVIPFDVEYGIGIVNNEIIVTCIDYGMCIEHNYVDEYAMIDPNYNLDFTRALVKNKLYQYIINTMDDEYYIPNDENIEYFIDGLNLTYRIYNELNKNIYVGLDKFHIQTKIMIKNLSG